MVTEQPIHMRYANFQRLASKTQNRKSRRSIVVVVMVSNVGAQREKAEGTSSLAVSHRY